MKEKLSKSTPIHKKGNELSVENKVKAPTQEAAKQIFNDAVERLLNVNEWHSLTGSMFAVFELADSQGNAINRQHARVNDYFKINIPAPGSKAGDGYDWVQVEMIDHHRNALFSHGSVTMRVRPVANPSDPEAGTAHFFKDKATSTFKIRLRGKSIMAAVYGRNEIPNTKGKVIDKIRNTTVAVGAILGGAHLQWQSLVKGILNNDKAEQL